MHPAASIIFFSTLSGLGYGLAATLGLGLMEPGRLATLAAYGLALALIGAGLLSSTLHLGNPQRAWRAFSQWRSSWLSREGVLAVLGFPVIAAHGWLTFSTAESWPLLGLLAALLSAATVYCTAMIYASLRSVQAWNTRLTPACYLAFAVAGGSLLANMLLAWSQQPGLPPVVYVALLLLAWGLKILWWRRMDNEQPVSTAASATGLGKIGQVKLFEPPHMTSNYLTREMGFQVARKHARKLRMIALLLGCLLPILLLLLALSAPGALGTSLSALAVAAFYLGVLTERWLFFAEARHAVVSYYGR